MFKIWDTVDGAAYSKPVQWVGYSLDPRYLQGKDNNLNLQVHWYSYCTILYLCINCTIN